MSAGAFPAKTGAILGLELDYTKTIGDASATEIQTFGGNFIVQSSPRARRLQYYGTLGFGVYGETDDRGGSGEVATGNFGGGVKLKLAGPLRLRLDYRVFLLGDTADASADFVVRKHPQRVSVGVGLAF